MEHLFRCPHPTMKTTRAEAVKRFVAIGRRKKKIPEPIMSAFRHLMEKESQGKTEFQKRTFTPAIRKAVDDQMKIGVHQMLRGYLAKSWREALQDCGVTEITRRMNALQRLIWTEWVDPIWKTRCDILHKSRNEYGLVEDERLRAGMIWFVKHKREALSYHDRYLANIDISSLPRMRTKTKKKWLHHLNIAKDAYALEGKQAARGQRTLDQFLGFRDPITDGVT
jgi:Trp operon repressor